MTAPTRLGLVVELPALRRGQLAQRLDGDGELAAGAPLVPHPADHAVDEQDRVVSRLPRRGERAGGGRARVQPFPGLARDDVRVEVGQQADPPVRLGRRRGVAGHASRPASPSSSTRSSSPASSPNSSAAYRGGMPSHLAKCWRRGRAVRVQVARDERAQRRVAVGGTEAGQPAVRVGVGHLAAPVRPEAQHPAVRGRAGELAPARPLARNASIVRSTAHGPARSAIASVSSSTVSSVSASASPMAAMTSSACPGVKRTPSGCVRHRRRQGRQRARPHRQVGGGQQVDGAARAERLDQGALLPERAPHVGAGRPGDAPPDRQLGGAEHLGVRAAQHAGDRRPGPGPWPVRPARAGPSAGP